MTENIIKNVHFTANHCPQIQKLCYSCIFGKNTYTCVVKFSSGSLTGNWKEVFVIKIYI